MEIDWLAVQAQLKRLGFDPGPLDGIRGPRTNAAIVAFKRSVGLRARPFFGPITRAALFGRDTAAEADPEGLPWYAEAMRLRGLHEARDVAALRAWFNRSVAWIDPREIPWCGAFVATCFRKDQPDIALPDNPLGARNWARWGQPCAPGLGALLVFWRGSRDGWRGHVGFYYGEDAAAFHVLGGNQSDAVTVTRIGKTRHLATRWPDGQTPTPRRVLLDAAGQPLSRNEA